MYLETVLRISTSSCSIEVLKLPVGGNVLLSIHSRVEAFWSLGTTIHLCHFWSRFFSPPRSDQARHDLGPACYLAFFVGWARLASHDNNLLKLFHQHQYCIDLTENT